MNKLKELIEQELSLYNCTLGEYFFRSRPFLEVRVTSNHTLLTSEIGIAYKQKDDTSFYPIIKRSELVSEEYLESENICQIHKNILYEQTFKAISGFMLFADKKELMNYLQTRENRFKR